MHEKLLCAMILLVQPDLASITLQTFLKRISSKTDQDVECGLLEAWPKL